jgi:hypothetical protein
MARMTEVSIPGSADGRTTWTVVCNFVAPNAREPSRNESGIVFKASSVVLIITGNIIMLKVNPPAIIDWPKFNMRENTISPKSPYIIEGIPARVSIASRRILIIEELPEYSFKKIAVASPTGRATAIETITT